MDLSAWPTSGPMTLNELAASLYLEKSSASRLVDGLEQKGIHHEEAPGG